jgi:poly(hydroxyalkanoate) depolymerase family esterase
MNDWWQGLKDRVVGWFRREPTPGRFEEGSKFSAHGWVGSAPGVWPARHYRVYVPKGAPRWKRMPLVVLIHGCRQTADDIARGTRITELADREGTVVLLPDQKDTANPWRCWNWFDPRTSRGGGEAAIVAAQIPGGAAALPHRPQAGVRRGHVVGSGAGRDPGVRFPASRAAVAVHSGIACGAARSAMTAITVLKRGPEQDVEAIASEARDASLPHEIRVPLLAIHGDRDDVVPPMHAKALVRQYLALNGDEPSRAPMSRRGSRTPTAASRTSPTGGGTAASSRAWSRSRASARMVRRRREPRLQRRRRARCDRAARRVLRRCFILSS